MKSMDPMAKIVRYVRKFHELTQGELAKKLDLTNKKLSKVETGRLKMSAVDWIFFCQQFQISPDVLLYEQIDELSESEFREVINPRGFKIPKKYLSGAETQIRSLLTFEKFYEAEYGRGSWLDQLKDLKLDSDYFTSVNNDINLNFKLDLISSLSGKSDRVFDVGRSVGLQAYDASVHGRLGPQYASHSRSVERIQDFLAHERYYGVDFRFEMLGNEDNSELRIQVIPSERTSSHYRFAKKSVYEFFTGYYEGVFSALSGFSQRPSDNRWEGGRCETLRPFAKGKSSFFRLKVE